MLSPSVTGKPLSTVEKSQAVPVQRSTTNPVSEIVLFVHCSRTLVELTAEAENTVGLLSVVKVFALMVLEPL